METRLGFCQCGCGQKTSIAKKTYNRRGYRKGQPQKFFTGHYIKEKRLKWNGGKRIDNRGYPKTLIKSHPKADCGGYVFDHILKAEKALGKPLPPAAQVHHFPNVKNPTHIIICEDQAYHDILEARYRAFHDCGHPDWRQCRYCHQWDDPSNMYIAPKGRHAFHKNCHNNHQGIYRRSHAVISQP